MTDHELAAANTPTLAIVGSEDRRLTELRALNAVIPSLVLVVIEGATHAGEHGALRSPKFLQSLRQFVARNSGGN